MASSTFIGFAVVLALALVVDANLGNIECENLKAEWCSYAVSWEGKRCVLEKHVRRSGLEKYTCTTSEIEADKLKNVIEKERCIRACGLDRMVVGISSDFLLESRFVKHLCSKECYRRCPNIVDLYFNLAAGEGVYLPQFCEANARLQTVGIQSSGFTTAAAAAAESPMMTPF